jgi:phosphoribosyl-dephospho-CoA transferase
MKHGLYMTHKLKDKHIKWLLSITTTHNTWLRRRWNTDIITRLLNILSRQEYDALDKVMLNDIREEWLKDFRKE